MKQTVAFCAAVLLLAACGTDQDGAPTTSAEGASSTTLSSSVASSRPETTPKNVMSEVALIIADVKLDPATRRGSVVNPCLAEGQMYEAETGDLLEATTGWVEIRDGEGATLAVVRFLVTREDGGSLVVGPLVGFFDENQGLNASREVVLLPDVEGAAEAVVVVEGIDLEPLEPVASLANLKPCAGTTGG